MKRSSLRKNLRPSPSVIRTIAKSQRKAAKRKYLVPACLSFLIIATIATPYLILPASTASSNESDKTLIMQPQNGSTLSGLQTFKLTSKLDPDIEHYKAFWKVDDGQLSAMTNSHVDGAHKEAQADVSAWSWRGQGPYTITFVTTQNDGTPLDTFSIQVFTGTSRVTETSSSSIALFASSAPSSTSSSQVSSSSAPSIAGGTTTTSPSVLSVVYPLEGVVLPRTQTVTLRASMPLDPNQYNVVWKVDGGVENAMVNDGNEKIADINVSGWNWNTGQYVFTFIARDRSGTILNQMTRNVWIGNAGAVTSSAVAQSSVSSLSSSLIAYASSTSSSTSSVTSGNGTVRIISPTPNQRMIL